MVTLLNLGMTKAFDLFCLPFLRFAPMWAMLVISLLAGVLMLWIFGKVSNQAAIKVIREKIRGNLIGVRLFQNDIGVVLGLQSRIILDTLNYMRYSLVPMLILMGPMIMIMTQLNLRFSVAPLPVGGQALVNVTVADAEILADRLTIEVPEGVVVETPGVHVASLGEVSWRIRAEAPGVYSLLFRAGDQVEEKELIVGEDWRAVSAVRTGKGFVDSILWPGEAPLASDSFLRSAEIHYPELDLSFFGWTVNWLIAFFILSIAFGFAFKDLLGVEI